MSISNKVKLIWEQRPARFICVGIINTLVDLAILNTLVSVFKLQPLIANLISASVSITLSYFLNHRIVFRQKQSHSLSKFAKFFAVTGLSILAIQSLVISIVTHILGTSQTVAYHLLVNMDINDLSTKIVNLNTAKLAAVILGMGWNYIFYHKIVFKTHISLEDDLSPLKEK